MPRRHRPLVLVLGLLIFAGAAHALPRYSAQYGQRCALCHVDPTGGGLRTRYATMALVPEELAFQRPSDEEMAMVRPDLSPAVTVGVDLRTLVYQGEGGEGDLLDMQGDVSLGLQMSPHVGAYVNLGKGGTQEYAGLLYVLPLDGYLKVGRFTPDYGWRWADHKLASREYLLDERGVTSPNALTEPGLEVGFHTQWWEATGSLLSGAGANGESFAGRVALRRELGPVNAALGASVIRRELTGGHARAAGGFGYLHAGPATWVFQVDETGNGRRHGLLISQELTWRLVRGIHARGTYTFHDPDRHARTGSRNRWGLGLDTLLSPFVGAQLMANYHHVRPSDPGEGGLVIGEDRWQAEFVLHLLY